MKRLAVYLNSAQAGIYEQDKHGAIVFQYTEQWLSNVAAHPLSKTLPLQTEAFKGNAVRPFFAGILPEEDPRRKIAAILGISERNDFAMLERIGGECAGAVCLLPEDAPAPNDTDHELRELSNAELESVISELPHRPLMADEEGVRLSLAGAQAKLPVLIRDDKIFLPLGTTPSSHIIKPEPEHFPGLAANEEFCLILAKAIGLPAPDVTVKDIGSTHCLIVERYDRNIGTDDLIHRIHQEDFCQALGFPPERKYQQEGGPLLRDCIRLLREWSTVPVLDIRSFIDAVIFNVLIGNADAHSKNFSFLYRGDSRRLAPFYDLVCTLAWPQLSKTLSMKIGKAKLLSEVTQAHFKKMAEECELGWPMIRERIDSICEQVLEILKTADIQNGSIDPDTATQISSITSERCERMLVKSM